MQNHNKDYFFSKNLVPGADKISAVQITRRWHKYVKNQLYISADFYSLKLSRSTETAKDHGVNVAAAQNSHTTTAMVFNVYNLQAQQRNHEILKKVGVTF